MDTSQALTDLLAAVVGRQVSHVWRGYGSTIYLELGSLTPSNVTRRDSSTGNPSGELAIGFHSGWRLEGSRSILVGSGDENEQINHWLQKIVEQTVANVGFFGRIPELQLELSEDLFITSVKATKGDPDWEIMDRRGSNLLAVGCVSGRVHTKEWSHKPNRASAA